MPRKAKATKRKAKREVVSRKGQASTPAGHYRMPEDATTDKKKVSKDDLAENEVIDENGEKQTLSKLTVVQ